MDKDITSQVSFSDNDSEYLPLIKCACGAEFCLWDFTLGVGGRELAKCPNCGRKMYFSVKITVFEVVDA